MNAPTRSRYGSRWRGRGGDVSLTDWRYRISIAEALELLDEAERFHVRTPLPDARPVDALKARIWIRLGDAAKALAWVRERGLPVDGELRFLDEFGHATWAREVAWRAC